MNWELFVTSAITILGFVVTYFMTRKSLKDEIQKNKVSISLEKMEEIPFEIMELLTAIQKGTLDVDEYSGFLSKIYSYCSVPAISITVKMQSLNYEGVVDKETNFRKLTLLSLLITQVKFDLTGEIVNPEQWFILKISDYYTSGMRDTIKKLINDDVDTLKLNKNFKVK